MSSITLNRDTVVAFLNSVTRPGCSADDADDDQNLVDAGMVDSLALIQIISWLESDHGVQLHKLGLDPSDLVTIDGILKALRAGSA